MASFKCVTILSELLLDADMKDLLSNLRQDELQSLIEATTSSNENNDYSNEGTLSYTKWYIMYLHTTDLVHLDRAIENAETQLASRISATGNEDCSQEHAALSYNLSCMLATKFRHGSVADLDLSIFHAGSALNAVQSEDENRIQMKAHLDKLKAMKKAVTEYVTELELNGLDPADSPIPISTLTDRLSFLMHIRNSLENRGRIAEAIEKSRNVVQETPPGHPEYVTNLLAISILLLQHAEARKSTADVRQTLVKDIRESIGYSETAMAVCLDTSDYPRCLHGLANSWSLMSELDDKEREIEYIKKAISYSREALQYGTDRDPKRAIYLYGLGLQLRRLFFRSSEEAILEEAFKHFEEALSLCQPTLTQPIAVYIGTEFGQLCASKYEATTNGAYLNKGIDTCEQVLKIQPGSPHAKECMHVLAQLYRLRYDTIEDSSEKDIERAVDLVKRAVENVSPNHMAYWNRQANLAMILKRRAKRFRRVKDIEEAHNIALQVLKNSNHSDSVRAPMLNILMELALKEYEERKTVTNIDLLVTIAQDTFRETSSDHWSWHSHAGNITNLLVLQAKLSNDHAKIDRVVTKFTKVVRLMPKNHSYRGKSLENAAILLEDRYELSQKPQDLDLAIDVSVECWNADGCAPTMRIEAAHRAARLMIKKSDWERASTLLEDAIDLLPEVSPRNMRHDDKRYNLGRFSGLVSLAMQATMRVGQQEGRVLEIVENGRGVLLGNLFQNRSDMARLKDVLPSLAKRYDNNRQELDTLTDTYGLLDASSKREALQQERQKVIEEIQAARIKDFPPKPTKADELMKAAASVPIIIVNPTPAGGDVLIILAENLIPIGLLGIKLSWVQLMADKLRIKEMSRSEMYDMLLYLWDSLVKPVLKALQIFKEPSEAKRHVRWIPLGPLCFLPIHAAGDYSYTASARENAMSHIYSSYIPSIKALLSTQQSRLRASNKEGPNKILLVSMEKTPDCKRLPFATIEVDTIKTKFADEESTVLIEPCKDCVRNELRDARIFHFAGHGSSHSINPLQSSLLLFDWHKDPLTVKDMLDLNLESQSPFLAFLSACSTGTSKSPKLVDEGIHLMSAFQLVGYTHVIGSLWELYDRHCASLAADVYDDIIKSGMTDDSVYRGLHNAVSRLRVGEIDLDDLDIGREPPEPEDDDTTWWNLAPDDPRLWAAYIHMG